MAAPVYDDSSWPLYRITLPPGQLDDDEFDAFVATLDGLFLRGAKFAVLLDARRGPPLAAKRRQTLGEHGKASFERYPGQCVGFAVLLSSTIQRGIFTAIHWFIRGVHPTRAFTTQLDAESWLVTELRAGGAETIRLSS